MSRGIRFMKKGGWLLMPGFIGFLIFYVIPFVFSFYYSVIKGPMDHSFIFLDNFIETVKNKYFRIAFLNTLKFSLVSVPATVVFSYMLAMLQLNPKKGLGFLRFAFVLPVLLPVASVAVIFKSAIGTDDMLLLYLFFIWKNCGLNMMIILRALLMIPGELYEASSIDGIGRIKRFFYITLPMTIPSVLFVIIWTIASSFKVFKELYLWYGAYPDESQYMLQHYMNNHYTKLNYQTLSTSAILFFSFIYLIVLIFYSSERSYSKNLWD